MYIAIFLTLIVAMIIQNYLAPVLQLVNVNLYLIQLPVENRFILLFVILNNAHLFWLSKLYEKGELKKNGFTIFNFYYNLPFIRILWL